jgi:hypothetical protein
VNGIRNNPNYLFSKFPPKLSEWGDSCQNSNSVADLDDFYRILIRILDPTFENVWIRTLILT